MSQVQRSIVLDGSVTSLKLEKAFWAYLDELAELASLTWAEFTRQLLVGMGRSENRAGYLKEALLNHAVREARAGSGPIRQVAMPWTVEVDDGLRRISRQFHSRQVLVGRGEDCDLLLDDEECSRHHCLLSCIDNRFWILDLESKNGTTLGKRQIQGGALASGQWFGIGRTRLRIVGENEGGCA